VSGLLRGISRGCDMVCWLILIGAGDLDRKSFEDRVFESLEYFSSCEHWLMREEVEVVDV
jgi:hypothetical protein